LEDLVVEATKVGQTATRKLQDAKSEQPTNSKGRKGATLYY
jgi:hypothetical protein